MNNIFGSSNPKEKLLQSVSQSLLTNRTCYSSYTNKVAKKIHGACTGTGAGVMKLPEAYSGVGKLTKESNKYKNKNKSNEGLSSDVKEYYKEIIDQEKERDGEGEGNGKNIKYAMEIIQFINKRKHYLKDKSFDIHYILPPFIQLLKDRSNAKAKAKSIHRHKTTDHIGINSCEDILIEEKEKENNKQAYPKPNAFNNKHNRFMRNYCCRNFKYTKDYVINQNKVIHTNNKSIERDSSSLHGPKPIGISKSMLNKTLSPEKMKLNQNCSKMRNNLIRQPCNQSNLKLNNNYQVLQGKNGIQLFLDTLLISKTNNGNQHWQSKTIELGNCNSMQFFKKLKPFSNEDIVIKNSTLRILSNGLIKSMIEEYNLKQINNNNNNNAYHRKQCTKL